LPAHHNPTGGVYSAPPNSLAGFKGPTSKGREGKVGEGEDKGMKRQGQKGGQRERWYT